MRRFGFAALAAMALVALVVAPAGAAKPHFVVGPNFTTVDGALRATGSIAGLGNADVTIDLTATGVTTCTNRGGNVPPGQTETVAGSQTITDVKNGRVNFDVTTASVSNPCPDGMRPTTTFTSAVLTVTQGGQVVLEESFTP
jgi:hypothetical protein